MIEEKEYVNLLEKEIEELKATIYRRNLVSSEWEARCQLLEEQLAKADEEIECWKAMKDGFSERARDYEIKIDILEAQLAEAMELISAIYWYGAEDDCEVDGHPETNDDDEHNRKCIDCDAYLCTPHLANCRVAPVLRFTEKEKSNGRS